MLANLAVSVAMLGFAVWAVAIAPSDGEFPPRGWDLVAYRSLLVLMAGVFILGAHFIESMLIVQVWVGVIPSLIGLLGVVAVVYVPAVIWSYNYYSPPARSEYVEKSVIQTVISVIVGAIMIGVSVVSY